MNELSNTNTAVANTNNMVVHSGLFHGDDALVAAMGKLLGLFVWRTNNPEEMVEAAYICDTGRRYDGVRFFDHHQGPTPTAGAVGCAYRNPDAVMAAAGLFWLAKGAEIVSKVVSGLSPEQTAEVVAKVDKAIIEPSDRHDNGEVSPAGETTLSQIVAVFNPLEMSPAAANEAFDGVVSNITLPLLAATIRREAQAVKDRLTVLSSPVEDKVLVLDKFVQWRETVVTQLTDVLFVVFPSARGGWNAQVVPKGLSTNEARLSFPVEWGGKVNAELASLADEPYEEGDSFFCHAGRFLIAAPTKEAVVRMCRKAMRL